MNTIYKIGIDVNDKSLKEKIISDLEKYESNRLPNVILYTYHPEIKTEPKVTYSIWLLKHNDYPESFLEGTQLILKDNNEELKKEALYKNIIISKETNVINLLNSELENIINFNKK